MEPKCTCDVCGKKEETVPAKVSRCCSCKKRYLEKCNENPSAASSKKNKWLCMECKEKVNTKQNVTRSMVANGNAATGSQPATASVPATEPDNKPSITHYGPIEGIPVGTTWQYRLQVSHAGVHRPPQAGIHGRASDGAYSIVLSGQYHEDFDMGDKFYYSGCGKDNQELVRANRALALSCACPLNEEDGGVASDTEWKNGKSIRVVRGFKLNSIYAPEAGFRYDGIYRVRSYEPKRSDNGTTVWRFLLERDDTTPPPWTVEGLEVIQASPEILYESIQNESKEVIDFVDADEQEDERADMIDSITEAVAEINLLEDPSESIAEDEQQHTDTPVSPERFELEEPVLVEKVFVSVHSFLLTEPMKKLITKDAANQSWWSMCLEKHLPRGRQNCFQIINQKFMCQICKQIANKPVTLDCNHYVCWNCIANYESRTCPNRYCQAPINTAPVINNTLHKILSVLVKNASEFDF